MLFPESAKNAISSVFFDKLVLVLSDSEIIDSEGGVVRTIANEESESEESGGYDPTIKSSFYGNVRFNALGELENEIGLTHNIDIAISCPTDTAVEVNDLLQYKGTIYIATDVLPYDSHKLITGQRWETQ